MDNEVAQGAPSQFVEVLEASVRDIACDNVHDAIMVQREAERTLAEFERGRFAGEYQHT